MSTNSYITYNGETHTVTEWARRIGINVSSLSWRKRNGWTDRECIEGRKRKTNKNKTSLLTETQRGSEQ